MKISTENNLIFYCYVLIILDSEMLGHRNKQSRIKYQSTAGKMNAIDLLSTHNVIFNLDYLDLTSLHRLFLDRLASHTDGGCSNGIQLKSFLFTNRF